MNASTTFSFVKFLNSCLRCHATFFENDTKAKEINANAVATFRVKFDHVAMDNFHAVFTGTS